MLFCESIEERGDMKPAHIKLNDVLRFDPDKNIPVEKTLTFFDGKTVRYLAYEHIYYVSHVVDPAYQYLNVYVPETAWKDNAKTPIFLKNTVGGYRAGRVTDPSNADASGRALREGYVVVIPGVRGWDSTVTNFDDVIFTGRAPAGIIDLKAAVRYLRYNHDVMPGDAERIISDGTSAGGAMSALLGVTGNNPAYEPYLQELGAADARDDIFAAICFCPIADLEHADMAYEWLYNETNTKARSLSPEQAAVSNELAALYPVYLNSLGLMTPNGTLLTDANYRGYLKTLLIESAQKARNAGMSMPAETGVILNKDSRGISGEFVLDIDLDTYINYIAAKAPLKMPPAFDQQGVLGQEPSWENNEFGDAAGSAVNFTEFSMQKSSGNTLDPAVKQKLHLMNPMEFIGDSDTAPNWYIHHGSMDRDTAFQIPINLSTKLMNAGFDVNFALAWNREHKGDYDLDNVFLWLNRVLKTQRIDR